MEPAAKKSVLFISIHNAVRSQMAQGLLKHFRGDLFEGFSAGVEPTDVDPLAVEVMKEIGIDIIYYRAKSIESFNAKQFDYVVTIVASASEDRPEYPNATNTLSWDFADPSKVTRSEQEMLDEYRKLRDGLTQQIKDDLLSNI